MTLTIALVGAMRRVSSNTDTRFAFAEYVGTEVCHIAAEI
jgi:hypothetical protein